MSIKKTVLVVLLVSAVSMLNAHPHMFFTSRFEVVFDGASLKGAYCEWIFDRFFSADIIQGFDINKDGKFNAKETQDIYNNAFIYTKNYYYFTFIRQGSKRTNPSHVSNFSARYKNGIVTYRFFIDLSHYAKGELFLATYDYTFFCDITYDKKTPVRFIYDTTKVTPGFEISENKNFPVYYSPGGSGADRTIYTKWKEGLETYYPKEVRIYYK